MSSSCLLYAILLWVFDLMNLGFEGIALASSIHFIFRFFVAYGLILKSGKFDGTNDIPLFSKESRMNLGNQFRLGLESMAMGVWTFWGFEIFTLMASYLPGNDTMGA